MADNVQCAFITDERIALGKLVIVALGERILAGEPLDETDGRILIHAAILARPDAVAELSALKSEKALRGKQTPSYQAHLLRRDILIQEAYHVLLNHKDFNTHSKPCKAIARAIEGIYYGREPDLPMLGDGFYRPLTQAVGLGCRVFGEEGVKKALRRLLEKTGA